MNFLRKIFYFIKTYPGILYSLFLIIFIPLALYYNTFLTIDSFQKSIDFNLQTKALMVEDVFSVFASDFLAEPQVLQQKIKEITKENPEITKLRIIGEAEKGEFKIIASQDPQEVGSIVSAPSLALSWSQRQTIANLISEEGERFWRVIKPVYDKNSGERIGLVSMALSLKQSDTLITNSVFRSYLLLIATIILCLFLIIQHAQLFGYVALSKKLRELDRMKDDFIRMATHELQAPITNIQSHILVLEEEVLNLLNEAQKEYIRRTSASAKNLSDLIYDILEVSRIEQGRLDFTPKKTAPAQLIKEVLNEIKPKAEQKNLKLVFKETKESCFISVNPNRFKQIIANLLENAIKYTAEGEVEAGIGIDGIEKNCLIFVRDTGLGISAKAQQRLFERFYRVRTKETAGISGTGLGLWISKQLCEKMGGKIFVESMEGVGSKFTIVFPLKP